MIIRYSSNYFLRITGIAFYNSWNIALILLVSTIVTGQFELLSGFSMPVVPISILGGALAIFLGFRNNSAYDRWWEARKIWGGIVNTSRSFASGIIAFSSTKYASGISETRVKQWSEEMIHRHIGWLYALKMHLRQTPKWEDLKPYVSIEELDELSKRHNKPAQLIHFQNVELKKAFEEGLIENFRHMELAGQTRELYNLQGKAERIKNTVFPYYYNYFTNVFLWLFIICLPFALVKEMGWLTIPMSLAISFVFTILEKSGSVTEDPFESRAADTPISSIVRTIEIDLLEMTNADSIPAPIPPNVGKFGVEYMS